MPFLFRYNNMILYFLSSLSFVIRTGHICPKLIKNCLDEGQATVVRSVPHTHTHTHTYTHTNIVLALLEIVAFEAIGNTKVSA
jgi:hypothetical protein